MGETGRSTQVCVEEESKKGSEEMGLKDEELFQVD